MSVVAKTTKAVILQNLVKLAGEFVQDGNLEFGEEGVYLQGMDSGNVSLFEFFLDMKMFEEYSCNENVTVGVSLRNLSVVLSVADKDDSVVLSVQENGDTLDIDIHTKKYGVHSFGVLQMQLDIEAMEIPEYE